MAGSRWPYGCPTARPGWGRAGQAEFTPERPIEDDTVFSIASVTKTFIAALILQLVDEGRLDLDEPFGATSGCAASKDSATIRQLLSHTSGIYNYFENPRYQRISPGLAAPGLRPACSRVSTAGRTTRSWRSSRPGYCKPGECYHYSNTNYVILGKSRRGRRRCPAARAAARALLRAAGHGGHRLPACRAAHRRTRRTVTGTRRPATSDHTRDARVVPFMAAASVADAAGAIASTAHDLTIWARCALRWRVALAEPRSRR